MRDGRDVDTLEAGQAMAMVGARVGVRIGAGELLRGNNNW